ncbi:hypothetical protein OF83DRAFT_1110558 [Amylostereum chailletii]|nr:hypothetical protein OF83DRAFT_1110558 [Amylostereum chailletii]
MPVPTNSPDVRSLNHVNLMVDTFIANATVEDLRATMRALLSSSPPATAHVLTRAARSRLMNPNATTLPKDRTIFLSADGSAGGPIVPAPSLPLVLAHARALYGAGLGLKSLSVFANIVRATLGRRWAEEGATTDVLTIVDGDVCQAIQSAKEEIEGGRAGDLGVARERVAELRAVLRESAKDVRAWTVEFPFERAAESVEYWQL